MQSCGLRITFQLKSDSAKYRIKNKKKNENNKEKTSLQNSVFHNKCYKIFIFRTQYQNSVMNIKLKITRF